MLLNRILLKSLHYRPRTCIWVRAAQRCLSAGCVDLESNKYFITTPIFYVNSVPHIGHVYTALQADAHARWRRLHGARVVFSTGTDEHGLKIQQAASSAGKSPQEFCDEVSAKFKDVFESVDISHTDFVRTTDERHKTAVRHFWRTLEERGHIYKGSYSGWYCTADEAFLTESQLVTQDGQKVSAESGHPVEWMEENNYMFRLSTFTDRLKEWVKSGVIKPAKFEEAVLSMLEVGLPDLSVSRQTNRVQWGIRVPGDDTQSIYVWLDALVNYLIVIGYPNKLNHWPPDCQVIGKDILKFHAVYWPAFLMAAGMELPKTLFVHSHWTIDGVKMSKSLGNVVDPVEKLEQFGSTALRYVLLKEGVPHSDGNYSDHKVAQWLMADLSNTLANLLGRSTGKLNKRQCAPVFRPDVFHDFADEKDKQLLEKLRTLPGRVAEHCEEYNMYRAVAAIMDQLRETSGFFQRHEPWNIPADQSARLECILALSLETLRICTILLQPVVPSIADAILSRLRVPPGERSYHHALVFRDAEHELGPKVMLIPQDKLRDLRTAQSAK